MEEAYVSLITNNDYSMGAEVLGKSLRNTATTRKLVLMVTNGVTEERRYTLYLTCVTCVYIRTIAPAIYTTGPTIYIWKNGPSSLDILVIESELALLHIV